MIHGSCRGSFWFYHPQSAKFFLTQMQLSTNNSTWISVYAKGQGTRQNERHGINTHIKESLWFHNFHDLYLWALWFGNEGSWVPNQDKIWWVFFLLPPFIHSSLPSHRGRLREQGWKVDFALWGWQHPKFQQQVEWIVPIISGKQSNQTGRSQHSW